jgi:hypothetical protein
VLVWSAATGNDKKRTMGKVEVRLEATSWVLSRYSLKS